MEMYYKKNFVLQSKLNFLKPPKYLAIIIL